MSSNLIARSNKIKDLRDDFQPAFGGLTRFLTQLSQKLAILISIPGIAEATAFAMLIKMPELGRLEGKQATSPAGLAPISRARGSTLAAVRFNRDPRTKFDQLIPARKPLRSLSPPKNPRQPL